MKKIIMLMLLVLVIASGAWFLTRDEDVVSSADPEKIQDTVEDVNTTLSKVEIFANESTDYGVLLDSSFTVAFDGPVDEEVIKEQLNIQPETLFEVKLLSDNQFEILPSESLLANTVYSITYADMDYGKAFQTVDNIRVAQSFPGNEAYDVPSNSVVELRFNSDDVNGLEDFFTIEPAVEGTFDYKGNTVVFMPESLKVGQLYTISIAPGLLVDEREMTEAYTFSFTTGYSENYNWNISYTVANLTPEETPILGVKTWNSDESYHVTVYQAIGFEPFLETYTSFKNDHNSIDFEGYENVFEEDVLSINHEYNTYIELAKLNNGRYIVLVEGNDVEQYTFLQIDPHQIYYTKATNGEMFWIIDGVSKEVEKEAIVLGDGQEIGRTNASGILLTNESNDMSYDELVVVADGKSYLVNNAEQNNYYYFDYDMRSSSGGAFWSFLYTDRRAYNPTDEIGVFGFLRSYSGEASKDLKIQLGNYWSEDFILEEAVTLNTDLSFTTQLSVEDLDYGYYELKLLEGDRVINSTEVFIVNYEKPEIFMTSDIEEDIVFAGDVLHYEAKASYFNELPYENMKVAVRSFGSDESNAIYTTDKNGEIHIEFEASDQDDYWYPNHYEIYAHNESVEDTYISTRAVTTILPRDTMILTDYVLEDGLATVDVATHLIDISNYSGNYGNDYESIKGEAVSKDLVVEIVDHYYEKIFVETAYDPIHKLSYDVYRYERHEDILPLIDMATVDGLGEFVFGIEEDHYYSLTLSSLDGQQRVVKASETVGTYIYKYFNYDTKYTMDNTYESYDIGDQVEKEVLSYGESISQIDGDMALHLILRDGILEYSVTNEPKIAFVFEEEHRPNVLLKTIYFDGVAMNIVPAYESVVIGYDYETLKATVVSKTDRTEYAPGDTVTLDLEITSADGSPFNGSVNVSVVDEAFFALFDDYFNIGETLHAFVYNDGILVESVSNKSEMDDMAAEAGEGGDDGYIRDDFKDTALFKSLDVKNGLGTLTFEVPDNLTSWRITINGVNKELEYLQKKINVNVSLPFFVRSLYNTSYISGDEVYVALKADGKTLNEGDLIEYSSSLLKGEDVINSANTTSNTKGLTQLLMGALTQGEYTFEVSAKANDQTDGIREVVTVEDTYLFFDHQKNGLLEDTYELVNSKGDTTLYLYNDEARQYQEDLYNSYTYSEERLEEMLARKGASVLLNKQFEHYEIDTKDLSGYQYHTGGLRFLSSSDTSAITSALVAGTKFAVSNFDRMLLIDYLNNELMNESLHVSYKAMILWGLAAQEQPVLLLVDEFLKINEFNDLPANAQLYILMALNEMGDDTRVLELYDLVADNKGKLNDQDIILFYALELQLNKTTKMTYTVKASEKEESVGLQNVYYMMQVPTDFEAAEVVLKINGETKNISLPGLLSEKIELESGGSFEVVSSDDRIHITEIFEVSGLDYASHKTSKLNLRKDYLSGDIKAGDLIEVQLTYDKAVDEYVFMRDTIPAGFEYAGPKDRGNVQGYYFTLVNNQDLYIPLYSHESSGSVSYYIRAVQSGRYHTEPAYIQQYYQGELYMTSPEVLEVN